MNSSDVPPTRIRTAIALSIAAHLCALWLLAALRGNDPSFEVGPRDDSPTLHVTTIVRRDARVARQILTVRSGAVRSQPRVVVAPSVAAISQPAATVRTTPRAARAVPRFALQSRAASRATTPAVAPAVDGNRSAEAPTAKTAFAIAVPVPTLAPTAPAPLPSAIPSPSPSPSPSTAATTTPVPIAAANFSGLFSQNYPPALAAPGELTAIRSRLSASVHIRVDVDETGRATGVRFVGPFADEPLARKIRSELLALHYVPADCNGLHCDGILEIDY